MLFPVGSMPRCLFSLSLPPPVSTQPIGKLTDHLKRSLCALHMAGRGAHRGGHLGVLVPSCFSWLSCKGFGLRTRHQMGREALGVLIEGERRLVHIYECSGNCCFWWKQISAFDATHGLKVHAVHVAVPGECLASGTSMWQIHFRQL